MAPRNAQQSGGSSPVRQCALTRARRASEDLLRFCLDPAGQVVPDLKNRLPGRGVWLTAKRVCVAEAVARDVFARAFKTTVKQDASLAELAETLLEKAALSRLSLANKAGLVTTGFAKVADAVVRGNIAVLIHASDAAPGGQQKLDGKAGFMTHRRVDCFNCRQLSLALGRANVIHAALSNGGACNSFLNAVERLEKYRDPDAAFAAA